MHRKYSLSMKAILLLSVLLLSAGTAKADADFKRTPKAIYYYGTIYGAGTTLCSLVTDGRLAKDFSRIYFGNIVEIIKKNSDDARNDSDVSAAIEKSYQDIKKDPNCKGKI